MPLISIITINYNNAEGLIRTMDSVMHQQFSNFEYIVIDGGSTDGSLEAIQKYSDKLAFYVSEEDRGIYHAQNKGAMAAQGKYLLFLNSGDFLCNNMVLTKVVASNMQADLVYGNMRINWGEGQVSKGEMPAFLSLEHMFRDTLWHPVTFIKRELFTTVGFYNENFKLVADYDFFFRAVVINKVSTQHIDLEISEYNTEGQSSNLANKEREKEERRRVHENYLSPEEILQLELITQKKDASFMGLVHKLKRKLYGK